MSAPALGTGDIIHLNVGGTKFSTSRQTLTWIPETFFTSLLSGRISSLHDELGAIFIDRDPKVFAVILNFLRTKEIDLRDCSITSVRSEAEFYGIATLVKRLSLCEDLHQSSCGDVLFHGYIAPPHVPLHELPMKNNGSSNGESEQACASAKQHDGFRGGRILSGESWPTHSRSSSMDLRLGRPVLPTAHSRNSSLDLRHSRNSSLDFNRHFRPETGVSEALRVRIIKGSHNWIAVCYSHFVCLYRMKENVGWHMCSSTPHMESTIERVALNAKVLPPNQADHKDKMLAIAYGNHLRLWSVVTSLDPITLQEIGCFNLTVHVDELFFIGSQLVAISHLGKVGVWHSMTQHWQIQDVVPITSFDTAGSFLLLGCNNGSIYYIDMQKFPLRMKDNDLLVTELYRDPNSDAVTALSVYLTPKTINSGNWIEIAYGTCTGTVRVIVQHPETVGHGPQLFQTFTVHRSPVTKVVLSEKYLVSLCSEYNHVRTWNVTRFRGMISTQPGSTPLSSFKIVSLEEVDAHVSSASGNDFGPFGEQDEVQVFVQKVVPETDQLFLRLSSNGKRVCTIKSVDGAMISAFCLHECDGSSRMGSRPRRYLFTGHVNGAIQMWDVTTALEIMGKQQGTQGEGGPTSEEILRMLQQWDCTTSHSNTPSISPSPSLLFHGLPHGGARLKASNLAFLAQASHGELSGTSSAGETFRITKC